MPVTDESGYTFFFYEVEFIPAQRLTNHRPLLDDLKYNERGPYAWIPYSDISKYLSVEIDKNRTYPIDKRFLPVNCTSDWYWWKFLRNLRVAKKTKSIPWQEVTRVP